MSTFTKKSIDLKTAEAMIEAARKKSVEISVPMTVVVTDEAGDVKAMCRMDGAPKMSLQLATDKAYTSAALGLPTHVWADFIKTDEPLKIGFPHTPRVVIFGGGYPIKEDGEIVGAIGLSGGHYSQDMECARAALDAVGAPID